VRDDPGRHVAAVGAPEHAQPFGVDEVVALERRVDDGHQVLVVDRAPARPELAGAHDRPAPLLRVARRAARVRVDDGVASAGVDLRLVEEAVAVLRERAAVDVQERRIGLALLEAGRPGDPRLDLGAVLRDGREALRRAQLTAGTELLADLGQLLVADEELAQIRRGRACAGDPSVDDVVTREDDVAAGDELRLAAVR
jgi:hypothetical protein